MSNFLTNTLIRGALPLVKENLGNLDAFILAQLEAVPLAEHETSATYMLIKGINGKCYVCLCTLDHNDKVVGIKEKKTLQEFILSLISNFE
jgi:hypothetical protein